MCSGDCPAIMITASTSASTTTTEHLRMLLLLRRQAWRRGKGSATISSQSTEPLTPVALKDSKIIEMRQGATVNQYGDYRKLAEDIANWVGEVLRPMQAFSCSRWCVALFETGEWLWNTIATAHERGIGPLQKAPAGCSNLSAFMGHLFRAHCLFQSNAGKWKWAIENQQRRYPLDEFPQTAQYICCVWRRALTHLLSRRCVHSVLIWWCFIARCLSADW